MLQSYCEERKLPPDGSHIEKIFVDAGFEDVLAKKTLIPIGAERERSDLSHRGIDVSP